MSLGIIVLVLAARECGRHWRDRQRLTGWLPNTRREIRGLHLEGQLHECLHVSSDYQLRVAVSPLEFSKRRTILRRVLKRVNDIVDKAFKVLNKVVPISRITVVRS